MSIEDIVDARVTPYISALKAFDVWGYLFTSKQLAFTMQAQTESNWCWAATSTSVSKFYWAKSPWTQCKVVNAELGRTDACSTPAPAGANVPWYLDRALDRTSNFVSIHGGTASFAVIRAEIDEGRVVGARIGWNNGGGHFMTIYGYSTWKGVQYLDIDDPIYGKSHLTLQDFSTNYQGSGTWTHYYLTKPYIRWWWPEVVLPEYLFDKIWEARQVLAVKNAVDPVRFTAKDAQEDARFGLTHRTFSLGLNQLLAGETLEPEPTGLRVFEARDGRPVAFFDVDDQGEGSVRSMSDAPARLDAFANALEAVREIAPRESEGETSADARLIQVPALNFEAMWIISPQGESLVVPMLPAGELRVGQVYPYEQAMEMLREAARPLADMDDTMGA